MKISYDFDSGSIDVVELAERHNIRLRLRADNHAEVRQWFHFTLDTDVKEPHRILIENAGDSSFADAWNDYQAMATYDQHNWFRVPTRFDGQTLVIEHTPEQERVSYAYFTPYDHQRHQQLIEKVSLSPLAKHTSLGLTPDGHDIDLLTLGTEGENKQKIWLIARQHPGETMAQWFMEGLLERLLGDDPIARQLLAESVFYLVPNMNPDGSVRGNHRTNSRGFNLNRQWAEPSKEDCPEVFYVRQAMHQHGVDLLLDVHGDETLPYNFIMAAGGSGPLKQQAGQFKQEFARANSDFQCVVDYNSRHQGKTGCCGGCGTKKLSMASEYVERHFGCLSMVLEMPFIDNANDPDPRVGWSAQRSMDLGKAVLEPILGSIRRTTSEAVLAETCQSG